LKAPRSRFGGLTQGQRTAEFSEAVRGFFRAKAQCFNTNGGDACGCRNPLGGFVVVILPVLWLWVKTLDLTISTAATVYVVTLLGHCHGAQSPLGIVSMSLVASFGPLCFLFFIFDLLCKRFSSSPCISSAVVALFIKRGESLFCVRCKI
jgi:hypothetical protein